MIADWMSRTASRDEFRKSPFGYCFAASIDPAAGFICIEWLDEEFVGSCPFNLRNSNSECGFAECSREACTGSGNAGESFETVCTASGYKIPGAVAKLSIDSGCSDEKRAGVADMTGVSGVT